MRWHSFANGTRTRPVPHPNSNTCASGKGTAHDRREYRLECLDFGRKISRPVLMYQLTLTSLSLRVANAAPQPPQPKRILSRSAESARGPRSAWRRLLGVCPHFSSALDCASVLLGKTLLYTLDNFGTQLLLWSGLLPLGKDLLNLFRRCLS